MDNSAVAHIRTPNDDELRHVRELWAALKQKSLPDSTDIGIELQTYLRHAVRMVGLIAGLHPVTGKPAIAGQFPLQVSEDGVARLHDAVRLWSAILSLWTTNGGNADALNHG
jgi:hypothetical protein